MEGMMIDRSIVIIFSFIIDISLSSKSVRLGFKSIRVETDNKVELEHIFELSWLLMDKNFSGWKIFKVLVICNNIDGKGGIF